jgi:triphosphoribosyl-dephospho-CoA synthase
MLEATAGSNSHRGAIWCIGLLVAAASINDHNSTSDIFTSSSSKSAMSNYMESHMESFMKSSTNSSSSIEHIAALAAQIAVFPDRSASDHETHGLVMRRTYGSGGARVEAQMGFPHVVKIGIPHLRSRRLAGEPEAACQLNTLLAIMSSLDDTCLLYRGGLQALETARAGAREILLIGGTATAPGMARLFQLDKDLLQLGASPGGSADLLAATLFLDSIDYARNDYTKNVHI